MNYFLFSVQNARDEFRAERPAVSRPIPFGPRGPRTCCADHAVVVETDSDRSLWGCGICGRLWAVPHR